MTTTTTHLDATIRIPFVKSARNKLQVRETLVVINLQAKVAPSHIGANHLPSSEERGDGKSFTSKANERSEIKKIITTVYNTDRPFINRCQQNQQFPFQKQNKQ